MLRYMIILVVFGAYFVVGIVEPGPSHPPTKGEVWPKPQWEQKQDEYFSFNPSQFQVKVIDKNCTMLMNAIERYIYAINKLYVIAERIRGNSDSSSVRKHGDKYKGALNELDVKLTAPCEDYPYFEMNESYNITVSATSLIESSSIWGVLRGLESFSQLFYLSNDYQELYINSTNIVDYPRYAHRGILLDTARHYISVSNILKMLDGMAINKMNVFHWHIVDDQSFPYQSEKFPSLSERGAYDPSMIYTKSDIQDIIDYAKHRGIRVVPEFDVPGHTRSWGNAYPNVLTECYRDEQVIGLGPMNPINNVTYKLLRDLFQEAQTLFQDKYFHIGGDEVELSCWNSNPELQQYMKEHNLTSASDLHSLFMRNTIPLLKEGSQPVVWQEVFDEGVPLSSETLVHVWKGDWSTYEMYKILLAGHRVIFSSSWYLDHLGNEFVSYYKADPRQMVSDYTNNSTLLQNVVGGEACMWGEMIDDRNVLSRVWPRASAAAEKLWSAEGENRFTVGEEVLRRIEEHTCRMIRRGIPAQPSVGPGFCVA